MSTNTFQSKAEPNCWGWNDFYSVNKLTDYIFKVRKHVEKLIYKEEQTSHKSDALTVLSCVP